MKEDINKILKSGIMSGYRANKSHMFGGEQIQLLEKEWCKKFKTKNAIAVNSATSGLWCALATRFDIFNKKSHEYEVIVTPYSMTCSASLPLLFGAKPVFVDIEPDFFCIDPEKLESKITSKTAAIIAVDLFGMPFSEEINKIAKKHCIPVIEDAAQAIGAKRHDKFAGTLGNIGVFSLNQHKHLSGGEGGVVVTDNDLLANKIRLLMNHGESINNELQGNLINLGLVGMNLRMTEITAVIARNQLKNMDKLIQPYIKNAKDFNIPVRHGCESTYYKYATLEKPLIEKEKYDTKTGYITPLYKFPVFRALGYMQNLCPVCEDVESRIHITTLKDVK